MHVGLEAVAAHVAALDPIPLADDAFPFVYCDRDGTWWTGDARSVVRVVGGDPAMAGAYRRAEFLADVSVGRVPVSCGGWRRRGTMRLITDWRYPELHLVGGHGKWRRSTHKASDLLARCPPGGGCRTVEDLLGHTVVKPLDALTTVDTGAVRQLLDLCPAQAVSFRRLVPNRPVVFDAGSWRAALAPIGTDEAYEFERVLLELTPPDRTPFSARNAKAQRAAAFAVVAGRDEPRPG